MEKYTKPWCSATPVLMIFLIDQSSSMGDSYGNLTKAEQVANDINNIIDHIILKNMDGDSPKNRCYLSFIGYGTDVNILHKGWLSDICDSYIRLEKSQKSDGIGKLLDIERPVWLDPIASGGTPMAQAFELAGDIIDKWLVKYPKVQTNYN